MSRPEEVMHKIMARAEHEHYGLRVTEKPLKVGMRLPPSRVWSDGEPTEDMLLGTSVFGIDNGGVGQAKRRAGIGTGYNNRTGFIFGKHVALVGGNRVAHGEDEGEWILHHPTVLYTAEKHDEGPSDFRDDAGTVA